MQSTHHTREGEGESRREKRGRATGQRLVRTRTQTRTHTAAAGLVQDDMWQPDQLVGISIADLGLTVD